MDLLRAGQSPGQSPIAALPDDILLLVFDCLHGTMEHSQVQHPHRATFPHAPSAVCRHWRRVVCSVSAFWAELTISLDGPDPTPIDAVRAHLTFSQTYPLSIIIHRHTLIEWSNNPELLIAKDPLVPVLDALCPHVSRWKKAFIPNLQRASLSPEIFHCAFTASPALFNMLCYLNLTSLHSSDTSLTFYDLVVALDRAQPTILVLCNISLHIDSSHAPLDENAGYYSLTLKHLSAATVAEYWRLTQCHGARHVTIEDCAVPESPLSMDFAIELNLIDLKADVDPRPLIADWIGDIEGMLLVVHRCPSFDDAVLYDMAGTGGELLLPLMDALSLVGCPNVSSGAVRALVQARAEEVARSGRHVVEKLGCVDVRECGPLVAEDREWFNANAVNDHATFVRWDDYRTVRPSNAEINTAALEDTPLNDNSHAPRSPPSLMGVQTHTVGLVSTFLHNDLAQDNRDFH